MISKLDPQQYPIQTISLTPILTKIASGTALLFVGSGFARNSINFENNTFPTAKELANSIGKLGGFESEGDLRYAAEKFLRDKDPQILVNYLTEIFSVKTVQPHQTSICKAPWRRVYTTNYDLCVEEASRAAGKAVQAVDLSDDPGDFLTHRNICVHLNGSLRNLTAKTINSNFKLSTSSYISPDSFTSSNWNYPFRRDLEMCSAIVFVGYSLYDIEIQKILFENPEFSKKTYFITAPELSSRERFTLDPFGLCIPIGAEGLAKELEELLPELTSYDNAGITTSILLYELDKVTHPARDSDVDRFLMYGDVGDGLLETALLTTEGAPLIVKRDALETALEAITLKKNIVVVSDFGNGKTVFLRSLKILVTQNGGNAYTVQNLDIYNREDLDIIAKSLKRSILFVDSYEQHLDFLQHFHDLNPTNITLVLAARSPNHERQRQTLSNLQITYDEISVDEMSLEDIHAFVALLDNIGFWGDRAGWDNGEKINFLQKRHASQISSGLLSLLQAPQMINRVAEILKTLFIKNTVRDTIFAICVLSTLDLPLTSSSISEIAGNDEIYSSSLRNNQNFHLLFRISGTAITAKSSLFALALIRHNFVPIYIVDQLLNIVTSLSGERRTNTQEHGLLKSLLRFSTVERFLPEKQRINNLVRYYENVKRRVSWLKDDPHYWLQYAMAQLAYEDYEKTQRYLDQAYVHAEGRNGYHTVHIDMQQSRLLLKMSAAEKTPKESIKLFLRAIVFLRKVPDDLQKYRLAERVIDVYNSSFDTYTSAQKSEFAKVCGAILKELEKFLASGQAINKGAAALISISRKLSDFVKAVQQQI